jgi:3-methyladenine DNA glycosylase AlkD
VASFTGLVDSVERCLQPYALPARRAFLSAGYAPTELRWLGVPVPALRIVVRDLARRVADEPPRFVLDLALALSDRGSIEGRQVGYELLERRPDAIALVDAPTARRLGRGHDNWASVDAFAMSVTGPAWRLGVLTDRDLLSWARSPDEWWRRTALVSAVALNTRSRGGHGDTRRTLLVSRAAMRGVTPMLGKALSWALRSLLWHDVAAVAQFVKRHREALPASVCRDVARKLGTGVKARVQATGRSRSKPGPRVPRAGTRPPVHRR